MFRTTVIRVLLSLLLLVSQQLASVHAMSHLTGQLGGTVQTIALENDDLSSAFAQDQSCMQCLAFAQLGGPHSHPTTYYAPASRTSHGAPERSLDAGAGTILAFQSRGPPQA